MSLSNRKVNPSGPVGAKLLIIGEAPGEDEDRSGIPFYGKSGDILNTMLSDAGISRDECRVTNILNYRPFKNKFQIALRDHYDKIEEGIREINDYITKYPPNLILTLGNNSFHLFLNDPSSLARKRGYIVKYKGIKTLSTYHPASVLYSPEEYAVLDLDIRKAVYESKFWELRITNRDYYIIEDTFDCQNAIDEISKHKRLSIDIESTRAKVDIICVGIAIDTHKCFVFVWNPTTFAFLKSILEDNYHEFILHNGNFDCEVLGINGIQVANIKHDTMVLAHVLFPELPRSLEFLTSIYSDEPYYKKAGRGEIPEDTKIWGEKTNKKDVYIYNAKDCCVTFECAEQMLTELTPDLLPTYEFEMNALPMARNIGSNGMLVDVSRLKEMENSLLSRWYMLQFMVNTYFQDSVNIASPKQLCRAIYEKMELPVRLKKKFDDDAISTPTADKEAIAASVAFVKGKMIDSITSKTKDKWELKLTILRYISEIKSIQKMLSSYIRIQLSPENRIRSTYKVTATETGRWGCEKYLQREGVNAQTFPRGSVKMVQGEPRTFAELKAFVEGVEEDKETEERNGENAEVESKEQNLS